MSTEEERVSHLIGHVYRARQELQQALNCAGKKWAYEQTVQLLIKHIQALDSDLRNEHSELRRPRIRVKLKKERESASNTLGAQALGDPAIGPAILYYEQCLSMLTDALRLRSRAEHEIETAR